MDISGREDTFRTVYCLKKNAWNSAKCLLLKLREKKEIFCILYVKKKKVFRRESVCFKSENSMDHFILQLISIESLGISIFNGIFCLLI